MKPFVLPALVGAVILAGRSAADLAPRTFTRLERLVPEHLKAAHDATLGFERAR